MSTMDCQTLGWEISNDIGEISSPESQETLFSEHSAEAVDDTSVTWDFTASDLWVGILSDSQSKDRGGDTPVFG